MSDATSPEEHDFLTNTSPQERTCWFFHRWSRPYLHRESGVLLQSCMDCGKARSITTECQHHLEPYAKSSSAFYQYHTNRCTKCGEMSTHRVG